MRYTLATLFLIVLLAPIVLRWAMGRVESNRPPKDALQLIIITPHNESTRREFEEAFNKYHQEKFGRPVDIDYRTYGGAAEIKRVLDALRNSTFASSGTYEIDLAWGGGDAYFDGDFKPHLQPLALDSSLIEQVYPRPALAGLRLYEGSTPPLWYGTALSSFGISYNRDVLRFLALPEPKIWSDLKDPRYFNWLILADPTRSSSARTVFMVIVEKAMADAAAQGRSEEIGWAEGMGLIRQIAANARNFSEGAATLPTMVGNGEVAASMTIDFYARSQMQYVGEERMRYIEPADASVINPDPIAMIKGAPHPELARRFVEFLLSEQGQRLFILRAGAPGGPRLSSLRRLPVRWSVYADKTNFTDTVDPFAQTSSFNSSRLRTATYRIIGELIEASCIDLLDELKETRQAILASPRASELDARLGRFPFDQKEALKRAGEYLDSHASPARKLEIMRAWMQEFRQEYQQLRKQAG